MDPYWESLPGPKEELPESEWERLNSVLTSAPGPSFWYFPKYPNVSGPGGLQLCWSERAGGLVPAETKAPAYLRVPMYCYVRLYEENKLLVWRNVGKALAWSAIRISTFDTRLLRP